MKKISRLTALLMALLMMFSATALATEDTITFEDLNNANYAVILSAAGEKESVIGKKALIKKAVYVVDLNLDTSVDWLEVGTEVTIIGFGILNYYKVNYEMDGQVKEGFIHKNDLTIQQPAPEITYSQWDGTSATVTLACTVTGAASYEWQRGVAGENGEIVWESIEGATSAELIIDATPGNLQYSYRCVAKDASGVQIAVSEGVMLIKPELAQWIATSAANGSEVSAEMLALASQASSLDSMMLVGDRLIHVGTGEAFASYDETTGILTHIELNVAFGKVENGAIVPLTAKAEADPAA